MISRLSVPVLLTVLCFAWSALSRGGRTADRAGANRLPGTGPVASAPPGIRTGLYALAFVTRDVGCAGGQREIICTSDAGRTWVRRYAGPETIVGLDLVTPRVGWAVGVHTLLRTTDGGGHWVPVGEPARPLRSVDSVTATRGWGIAGGTPRDYGGTAQASWPFAGGTLVHTLNGGYTWAAQPAAGPVDSICFDHNGAGWAAHEATVRSTRDGGRTWRTVATLPIVHSAGWFATIQCAGATVAWVLLSGGFGVSNQQPYILYRTGDGGRRWRPVLDEGYFEGVSYPSYYPTFHVAGGPGNYTGPLSVVNQTTAYIVGLFFASNPASIVIAVTRDGGRTVRQLGAAPGLAGAAPLAGAFVDATHGWIAGTTGHGDIILATTNGGRSWTRQV